MSIFKRSALGLSVVACATLLLPVFAGTANAAPGAFDPQLPEREMPGR